MSNPLTRALPELESAASRRDQRRQRSSADDFGVYLTIPSALGAVIAAWSVRIADGPCPIHLEFITAKPVPPAICREDGASAQPATGALRPVGLRDSHRMVSRKLCRAAHRAPAHLRTPEWNT